MKAYSTIIIGLIGLFHVALTLHSFYLFFSDFDGEFSVYMLSTLLLALYTVCWLALFLRKRIVAYAYFMLTFFELLMRLSYSDKILGQALGDVLFPANCVFSLIILFMYRYHFNQQTHKKSYLNS